MVLNLNDNATEALLAIAEKYRGTGAQAEDPRDQEWRSWPVGKRLEHALVKGSLISSRRIPRRRAPRPRSRCTSSRAADGWHECGGRFVRRRQDVPAPGGEVGPVMKRAVAYLQPYIEAEKSGGSSNGKIVLATVKGDVHDIGKNIVGVVLQCNNFEIVDLGSWSPARPSSRRPGSERRHHRPVGPHHSVPGRDGARSKGDGASGFKLPLLIGGATTSKAHTAVKIEQNYSGARGLCLQRLPRRGVAQSLLSPELKSAFVARIDKEYEIARDQHARKQPRSKPVSLAHARANRHQLDWVGYEPRRPGSPACRPSKTYPSLCCAPTSTGRRFS